MHLLKIIDALCVLCIVHCVVNFLYVLTQVYRVASFRIADAEENLGESEVREAHLAKSLFYIRIGDKVGDPSCDICLLYFYLHN